MSVTVLGVVGSLAAEGTTARAVAIALEAAHARGARTAIADLHAIQLPFCDGRAPDAYGEQVDRWRALVRQSHGVILASPEYHNSLSGVLKNALDLLATDDLRGKMCGLIGLAGGHGAINTINTLRTICRAFGAWVVPQQVSISHADRAFTPDGGMPDALLRQRLERLGGDVARYAALLAA